MLVYQRVFHLPLFHVLFSAAPRWVFPWPPLLRPDAAAPPAPRSASDSATRPRSLRAHPTPAALRRLLGARHQTREKNLILAYVHIYIIWTNMIKYCIYVYIFIYIYLWIIGFVHIICEGCITRIVWFIKYYTYLPGYSPVTSGSSNNVGVSENGVTISQFLEV